MRKIELCTPQNLQNILCMQNYYKILHHSDVKIPRVPCIFICTDMNNQMIANHPHIYVLVSFICTYTNNRMVKNHPCLSLNDKHIIPKAHLVSLSSVYSPIQSYIQRYTRIHTCKTNPQINIAMCISLRYLFMSIISARNTLVKTFIKAPHNF